MLKGKICLTYVIVQILAFLATIFFLVAYLIDMKLLAESNLLSFISILAFFVLSFVPYILAIFDIKVTKTLQIYFLIAIGEHFIGGNILNLYVVSRSYNYITHITNSIVGGLVVYDLLSKHMKVDNKVLKGLIVVGLVLSFGIYWELSEFLIDTIFGTNMQRFANSVTKAPFVGREALIDTMIDISLDLAGVLVSLIIAVFVSIKGKKFHRYFAIDKQHELDHKEEVETTKE